MSKLGPLDTYWHHTFAWVGHPECEQRGPDENLLIDRRCDVELIGGVVDENAGYEYDEFALVQIDGVFYLLQTIGCSCPSPSETWHVRHKGTIADIRAAIISGEYDGYTLPGRKRDEFLALIDKAAEA